MELPPPGQLHRTQYLNRSLFFIFLVLVAFIGGLVVTSPPPGIEAQPTLQSIKYSYTKQSLCQKVSNSMDR